MESQLNNTEAFETKREIFLTLTEVTQDNFCRFALKLVNTFNAGLITNEELGGFVHEFEQHCKIEKIDTTIQY